MSSGAALADEIEVALRGHGVPERAAGAKRYLKSELDFIGVTTPELRRVVTRAVQSSPWLDRVELIAAVRALWARPVFELRAAAVELLIRLEKLMEARDISLVEALLRGSGTWALVDGLAPRVAGSLVVRFPELARALDRWALDDDFWLRRAALLALLVPLRRGGGDFERFARYADGMLGEREFFIRKAIGWVLREVGKSRPALVVDWLGPRLERASGVTFREAVRHLPAGSRAALLEARRQVHDPGRRGAAAAG